MANPRYSQQREPSKREQQTDTALRFANLGLEQQQLGDRAHAARVAQAIQLLGLQQQAAQDQMQQQRATDVLGLQKDELGFRREDASRQGQQFDQRLGFDKTKLASEEHQTADASQRMLNLAIMQYLGGNPSVPSSVGLKFASSLSPEFGPIVDQATKQDREQKFAALGMNPDGTPVATSHPAPSNYGPTVGTVAGHVAHPGIAGMLQSILPYLPKGPQASQQGPPMPQQPSAIGVDALGQPKVDPQLILRYLNSLRPPI